MGTLNIGLGWPSADAKAESDGSESRSTVDCGARVLGEYKINGTVTVLPFAR
jgi:hypothetical protein